MGKTHLNLYADSEIIKQCKDLGFNLSEILEESLLNRLSINKKDINNINIRLTKEKLKQSEENLSKVLKDVETLRNEVKHWEQENDKKKQEELEKEKKQIEESKKCGVCGKILLHKPKTPIFDNKGVVCEVCFYETPAHLQRDW